MKLVTKPIPKSKREALVTLQVTFQKKECLQSQVTNINDNAKLPGKTKFLRENEIHSRDTRQQSGTLSGNYKVTNDTKVKYMFLKNVNH